jgi:hypothetical protein
MVVLLSSTLEKFESDFGKIETEYTRRMAKQK